MNAPYIMLGIVAYAITGWLLYAHRDLFKFCSPIANIKSDAIRVCLGLLVLFACAAILAISGTVLIATGKIILFPLVAILASAAIAWALYTKEKNVWKVVSLCEPVATIENSVLRALVGVTCLLLGAALLAYGGTFLVLLGKILIAPFLMFF